MKKGIFKRILKGVGDIIGITGIKDNLNSEAGGKGKLDWTRLAPFIVILLGLLAVMLKAISEETFNNILEFFISNSDEAINNNSANNIPNISHYSYIY